MGTFVRLILASALLAVGVTFTAPSAAQVSAASCVSIYRIQYDSPGSDTGSNSSLNAEWIQLKNACTKSQAFSGWKVKDLAGHTYTFGTYALGASSKVRIHTGHGTNTSTDRYWNQGSYIWNNTGDTAYLKNGAGTTVNTCMYSGGSPGYVYC
jgi:hypothetical protein